MARYRKKPVVIEAVPAAAGIAQSGKRQKDLPNWAVEAIEAEKIFSITPHGLMISTLEGDHFANSDDMILQGVNGEIYPCKPDIFEKTYEAV